MKTQMNTVGTTAAEAEALAATAAALAAGGDPFGDDGDDADGATDAADETTAEAAEEAGEGEKPQVDEEQPAADETTTDGEVDGDETPLSAEALASIAADDETPEPAAAPTPRYNAGDPAEFKAKRDEQNAVKAKALKDLMDGVIEPEEYSRIESEVADKLEQIAVQRTLHEANVQSEAQQQSAALDRVIAAAKKAGEIDYMADTKAAKQFDIAMNMLQADGERRTYAELTAEAHKMVMAHRGITKAPAAAPAPAATPAVARENGKGPMTLRNVPAAETANSGGGWKEQLATLSGQEYEAAYAKLSQGQKDQLLDD